MSEKYEEVYRALVGTNILQKRKYDKLISKYGALLVDRVIEDMIEKDDANVFKFGYYLSVKSEEMSLDGTDSYKSYQSDMRLIPRLNKEDNQTLALEIYDIISRMNVLFESKLISKLSINEKKQFLIADKMEYWLKNIDDLETTKELKNLYSQFVEKRNQLVEGNLRLVIYMVRRYNNCESELVLNDLIQFGNMGLLRAVEKYNPKYNSLFSTYACYWVLQAIKRGIKSTSLNFSNKPHELVEWNGARLSAIDHLSSQLGRTPARVEIAEYMGISVSRLEYIEENMLPMVSLNSNPVTLADDIGDIFLIDCIEDSAASFEETIFLGSMREQLMSILMDENLFEERDRNIILYLYGFIGGDTHTFEDTGKHFGVTKQRVHQVEQKMLRRLRGIGMRMGINEYL